MSEDLRPAIQVRAWGIVTDFCQYFVWVINSLGFFSVEASDGLKDIRELSPTFLSLLALQTPVGVNSGVIFYNSWFFWLMLISLVFWLCLLLQHQHSQFTLWIKLPINVTNYHAGLMLNGVRPGCELCISMRPHFSHPWRLPIFNVCSLVLLLIKFWLWRECHNLILIWGMKVMKIAANHFLFSSLWTDYRSIQLLMMMVLARVSEKQEWLACGWEVLVLFHKVVPVRRT